MQDLIVNVKYFAEPGPHNTAATITAARERAEQLGITHVVVASDTGKTAREVLQTLGSAFKIAVVTNPPGIRLPVGVLHEYLPRFKEHKQQMMERGIQQISSSLNDATIMELIKSGAMVSRIDWNRLQSFVRINLAALDWIGVGLRVALTCAVWAYMADAVPAGHDILSLAGTGFGGGGADTAIVVRTGTIWKEWRILETIVRPRESPPSEAAG